MGLRGLPRGPFCACLLALALLPFLYTYLAEGAAETEANERLAAETAEALRGLQQTVSVFDQFMEERRQRRQRREADREGDVRERLRERAAARGRATEEAMGVALDKETSVPDHRDNQQLKSSIEDMVNVLKTSQNGRIRNYYEARKGMIPILVVCHNRAVELSHTLDSVLELKTVDPSLILVSQDGLDVKVRRAVEERNLTLLQNVDPRLLAMKDGSSRIAEHYRFSLKQAFERFSDAPAIIILEDDLLVSPDFLVWFAAAGTIMEHDSSIWCVSAWNDNGFKDRVKDPYGVRRTILFPGLGWLLSRSEYETNLRDNWPSQHWDWFVRRVYQKTGRECLYPEIPRTFHTGRKGTFVSAKDQEKIFDKMARNVIDIDWFNGRGLQSLASSTRKLYDKQIESLILSPSTIHVNDASQFENIIENADPDKTAVVIWYEENPDPRYEDRVLKFTQYFGIWHQLLRSSHESMHELYLKGVRVFLINVYEPRQVSSTWFTSFAHRTRYARLRPNNVPVFTAGGFIEKLSEKDLIMPKVIVPAESFNISCTDVCANHGNLTCMRESFKAINRCSIIPQYFPCKDCRESIGTDQPCFVSPEANRINFPEGCLIASVDGFECEGRHPLTKRLCPCG